MNILYISSAFTTFYRPMLKMYRKDQCCWKGFQIFFAMNSKNKAEPRYLCSCTWTLLLPEAFWLLYPANMGLNETIWHAHTAHSGRMSLCIQPVFQIYLDSDLTWGLWGITVLWSYTAHILTRWIHTSTMVCNWTIPSAGGFKLTVCVLVCSKGYISCTDSDCTVRTRNHVSIWFGCAGEHD